LSNWKLVLEYDGTRYSGWQEQENSRTVAGELRKAVETILEKDVQIDGAGRTDAGVHALAQVARIKSRRSVPARTLLNSLNKRLPKDINILSAEEASPNFHPRHDAFLRYYLYQISTRRSALAKPFVWWISDPLDLERIREAASFLIGRHNFERFCDKRTSETSTIVIVEHAELETAGDLILFRIAASHFLWKMVRRITGALVEVGLGKLSPAEFEALVQAQSLPQKLHSYSVAAHTAPASGLFLERVLYDEEEDPGLLTPAIPVRSHGDTEARRRK